MERKLVAILAADVVGYSALMERDEAGTYRRLASGRKELFEPEIRGHHGRIFKLLGDGLLAEFNSVVDAVECAVSIQRGLAERNRSLPESERITVRMGVNLGEVIVEGKDRYGEGVNVAARLEQLAQPGGICVSAKVAREVANKLSFSFESIGEQRLKNISEPVGVFRVLADDMPERQAQAILQVPTKPSIAVLAFNNLGSDPDQEYFADGLVEDLITSLSKVPGFFVIARNSSFAYKGKSVDVRSVAKDLGVRYVLEGSVRRSASRLRITGQLIDGSDGTHVWADKFEGAFEDIFDLQDSLCEQIVGAMEPSLRRAEVERARRKRPDSLDAYDLFLRALPIILANTSSDTGEGLQLLERALSLDPNYPVAHAYLAWGFEQRFLRGGFHNDDRQAALEHAQEALRLGTDDPQALSIASFVLANITHEYERSLDSLDVALKLNSNSALAYGFSALVCMFSERYERAQADAQRALRLSPFDPLNYHPYLALAWSCLFTGRFREAADYSAAAIQCNSKFSPLHVGLVASQVRLGQMSAAQASAARLIAVAPDWTIGSFVKMELLRPHLSAQLAEDLAKVGLPD